MEGMLGRFQSDLGSISTEIRSLQEQSSSMSVRLKNRRVVQERLGDFIQHVGIPPPLIFGIVQGEIGEEFLRHLEALAGKLEYAPADQCASSQPPLPLMDVAPELERLKVKAVARCRDFLMDRIYDMRRPKTNLPVKQSVLLKYRYMASFLKQHAPDIYAEVRGAYVDKVGQTMLDLFRAYWAAMERLEEVVITAADALGAPEAASGAGLSLGAFFQRQPTHPAASSGLSGHRADVYALRDRAGVLAQLGAPPLVLHRLLPLSARPGLQVLFRSLHRLLMDTAAHEYLFCLDMWGQEAAYRRVQPGPHLQRSSASAAPAPLAARLLADPLAIMLMIRINRENSLAMSRRRLPALDGYFDRINLALWPRLKVGRGWRAAGGAQRRLEVSLRPPVGFWGAALMAACGWQHGRGGRSSPGPLPPTPHAVMNLLLHLSRQFPARGRGTVFLIINFSYVAGVLKNTTCAPAGLALLKEFEDSLARCTSLYTDDQLARLAPQLVSFVKRGEAAAGGVPHGQEVPGFSPAEAAPVAADFSHKWQHLVEAVNRRVVVDFGATAAGRSVLQSAFTQLLLHYNRFLELCKRQGAAGMGVVQGAVTLPSIMYYIKQYSR
ncbi:hypothetical protein CHLNCDRAFT_35889 [Chlorella variabilis]|uniref:Vacuolar protein sorting-associated protein 52 homolog n=1 Tax=Chlorella variabilis TaxID=554065 RepID=E1ZHH5_CHLVA|nr:hypothetical protein CHLNCDRAFT_35889 [Chlorella variabilis]EFN54603.1 hypothetical protein CHLNCDRAFT_35889 [Chlorella variabilis]|eukprot:XP_005846705.1 hypothetical protein CHLNCDRAFT_35889 [Chlorella variabilis]